MRGRRAFAVALCLAISAVAAARLSAAVPEPPLRFGAVTVETHSPFDDDGSAMSSFFRSANALHTGTRPALIRSFLVFREGQPFDAKLVDESERNLRALDFLRSVSITIGTPHDGVVDVAVVTEDAWTTDPNVDFGRVGNKTLFSGNVTQKNLLGSGREVSVTVGQNAERQTRAVEYIDPAFLVPYLNLDTLASLNSDGNEEMLSLSRPFYSYTTQASGQFVFDHGLADGRVFEGGEPYSWYRKEHAEIIGSYSRAIGSADAGTDHLIAGIDILHDRFSEQAGLPAPVGVPDRSFQFFQIGWERRASRFLKLNYVDDDDRFQDFDVSRRFEVLMGISPSLGTGRTVEMARLDLHDGLILGSRSFAAGSLSLSSRFDHGVENGKISGDIHFVSQTGGRFSPTLVSRLGLDYGRNLDPDTQFFLDGLNGLRAYPAYAYEGTGRVVFNVEERFSLGRELWQLFGPGAALFADFGEITKSAGSNEPSGWKGDIGAGLRFALPRFDQTVIRFDLAYPIDSSFPGGKHLVLSVSTNQAF